MKDQTKHIDKQYVEREMPVDEIKKIGDKYEYDLVIILAKKNNVKHVVTWGRNKEHCDTSKRIGRFFKRLFSLW